jgi:hypothetical protein
MDNVNLIAHDKNFQRKLTWCDLFLLITFHKVLYAAIRQ